MKVVLLGHTQDPGLVCAVAALSCRSKQSPAQLMADPPENWRDVLRRVVGYGHSSVLEHANFTFSIEGISRSCSHQLVRHRIASYSQQSERVVVADSKDIVIPKTVKGVLEDSSEDPVGLYQKLISENVPPEDARFLLPQGIMTHIVVTMNARELVESFFPQRLCVRAQWEIRNVAKEILTLVRPIAPELFENAGCRGDREHFCREMNPCGKHPTIEEAQSALSNLHQK